MKKIREADYEEESFRQWEYTPDDDDDYTYEQYAYEEDTLTDYLLMRLQFSNLKGKKAAVGKYIIEAVDDNGYLTVSVEEISRAMHTEIETVEEVLGFIQTFDPCGVVAKKSQRMPDYPVCFQGSSDR